jgi:hypothetical protein
MYRPGDFTVTPIPHGYMVGRLIERAGTVGPWWEYIKAEIDIEKAIGFARELAERAAVRAWIYESPQEYLEITRTFRRTTP